MTDDEVFPLKDEDPDKLSRNPFKPNTCILSFILDICK